MTRGTIDNGRVVHACFGEYAGPAGMAARNGAVQIAFFGEIRKLRGLRQHPGTIDGEDWHVIDVAPSEYVKGMVVLTVEPISEGEAA